MKRNKPVDLKSRVIEGAFWNAFFAVANKTITAIGQFALAWFLMPADMGLANMAQAMAAFTAILSVGGLGDVLLQRRKFKHEAGQAFWLSAIFSTATALAIGGMALVCPLMGKRPIMNLLWFLALATLVGMPATIMAAGLKNRLDYKGLAFSQFASGLFYTPATVLLAWWGWGPYALIAPLVPKQLLTLLVMGLRGGAFPLVRPVWDKIRELARPTLSLSLTGLFTGLQTQGPIFLCGIFLGAEKTGFFSWGWMVAGQVVFLLAVNLREVLLPTFTHIGSDNEKMKRAALKAAHAMSALLCVACGTQALLANVVIQAFLPTKWFPAIPIVALFSLGLVSQGLWISGAAWLNARGKYKELLFLSAAQVLLNAGLTLFGGFVFDFVGAAIGCALAMLLGGLAYGWPMVKNENRENLGSWMIPAISTLVLWPVCFLISWKHGWMAQVFIALLFAGLDSWVWWRSDKGGLRAVGEKLIQKIRPLTVRAGSGA